MNMAPNDSKKKTAPGYSKIIREAFETKNERTVKELYDLIKKDKSIKLDPKELRHRVRSCIYGLKKSNAITRIGNSRYKEI